MDDPNQIPSLTEIWQIVQTLQKAQVDYPDHFHNGFDFSKVNWKDLAQRKIYIPYTIPGTNAATAANYSQFYISYFAATVTGFKEVHAVLGTDGSPVTLQLEKLTGTTAPGSGTTLLTAGLSLKATINTVQTGVLTAAGTRTLKLNDRLAFKLTGTPTSVANVTGIVELTMI